MKVNDFTIAESAIELVSAAGERVRELALSVSKLPVVEEAVDNASAFKLPLAAARAVLCHVLRDGQQS